MKKGMAIVFVYKRLLEQTHEESGVTAPAAPVIAPAPERIEKPKNQGVYG